MVAQKQINGFTFVEVIISVALLALIGLLITNILLNTMRGILKAESVKDVKQSGEYALTVMSNRLRNAQSVTVCTPGMSSFEFINPDNTTTQFFVAEDPPASGVRKLFADTNGDLEVLTESNTVTVDITDDLTFDCDSASGKVGISFLLRHVTSANAAFEDQAAIPFSMTIVRRRL